MAKKKGPTLANVNQSPSSTPPLLPSLPKRGSPLPKHLQQGSTTPAKDRHQHPKCPPSFLWSSSSSSPHHPLSPSAVHRQPPSSYPSSTVEPSLNTNSNNNSMSSCSASRAWLANGDTNGPGMQQTYDPLWSGSHNRVARPFSASEPSSRVQSPTLSPTAVSFSRLCSPPPQHNFSSPMANKPPHPRRTRVGSSHNPLGLTLELPRASSASAAAVQSSYMSPQILSPPPIGVSVNVWANNVAAPQPRNPRLTSSSPFSPSLTSPTFHSASFPTFSSSMRSSRASSPTLPCSAASQTSSQTLRRSFSTNLADRPPSPARSNPGGLRRSWAESSRRSLDLNGSGQGLFDQQGSGPPSPRNGWSSYCASPSCLSPQAGHQSPTSPGRLTSGKGSLSGQHFTSVPWPDVRELSNKYNGVDGPDASATSSIITSAPCPLGSASQIPLLLQCAPSEGQTEWEDPELEDGNCRTQLICAYVAHPTREHHRSPACSVVSSSGLTSPHHKKHQSQIKPQPKVQHPSTTSPVAPVSSPLSFRPSPPPFTQSSAVKPGNQRTSYATTVNLQIAGSGRITSFSTAQVSLTQTLQGGAPSQGQLARRVSINGLSHLPSPLPQN